MSGPSEGCGEDWAPPITQVIRLSDSAIIAQHSDPWYDMAAFSMIYVPRYEYGQYGPLKSVDVFPLQCD